MLGIIGNQRKIRLIFVPSAVRYYFLPVSSKSPSPSVYLPLKRFLQLPHRFHGNHYTLKSHDLLPSYQTLLTLMCFRNILLPIIVTN